MKVTKTTDAGTCPNEAELAKFAAGLLPSSDASRVLHHLESCSACAIAVESLGEDTPDHQALTTDVVRPVDLRASSGRQIDQIGDYRILNVIAEHGQGIVYRADHPHLNRQVVIKVGRDKLNESSRQTVLDEGKVLAGLSHPNLAQIYDLQFDKGCPFLVMEFIEGRNLADCLKDSPMSPSRSAELVATIARAIDHAHQLGVVHRDLKPANVVIRAVDGTPKVIDFGLASAQTPYSDTSSNSGEGGTLHFMAPEQAARLSRTESSDQTAVDPRSDIFSLGAILYRLLAGRTLYGFENVEEGIERAKACEFDESALNRSDIPAGLRDACLRALSKQPEDRWGSAAAFADAIEISQQQNVGRVRSWLRVALVTCVVGLVFAFGQLLSEPKKAPVRFVESPEFTHLTFEDGSWFGGPLFMVGGVYEGDSLRIRFTIDRPTDCFAFVCKPDGSIESEVCVEDKGAGLETSHTFDCPVDGAFSFTEGPGQYVVVIVASDESSPAMDDWEAQLRELSCAFPTERGRWVWQNSKVDLPKRQRSKRDIFEGSEEFVELMQAVERAVPDGRIYGLTFPVDPVDQNRRD